MGMVLPFFLLPFVSSYSCLNKLFKPLTLYYLAYIITSIFLNFLIVLFENTYMEIKNDSNINELSVN